jgi:polyphosphate glucokinase
MTSTDSTADTPDLATKTAGATPQRRAFGVDVGGSGIKGGIVDLDTGQLVGDRFKLLTPQPATPSAVAKTIAEVVNQFGWTGPLGVTYPGVVTKGVVRTAANVDDAWIGTNASDVIGAELHGQDVTVLNDADAAGLAEERYGAGKDNSGLVILLTFGTGIGSAVIHNGKLIPNTELGHLEVGGKEAEHRAASSVRDKHDWSYKTWAKQVTRVLVARLVHRRWRHQPQGRQMAATARKPHRGGGRRLAEHRRNSRRSHGFYRRCHALNFAR